MKSICVFLFLCLKLLPVLSPASIQHDTDTPRNIASEYMQNIYNEETKSFNPSYNYSNLWDIDGDKKTIPFILLAMAVFILFTICV
nr:hypothetical protein [Bacteroidota bacterium]